jgi:hypothetical protein
MTTNSIKTKEILDRLFLSGHVVSHNEATGVFSVMASTVVSQKDGSQIQLYNWLIEQGVAAWSWSVKQGKLIASKWIASDGERIVFRPVSIKIPTWLDPRIDNASLLELMIHLDLHTFVSNDQDHVIEPEDGVLAWHDHETGLMWDAARIINESKASTNNPATILNASNYAGYSDWRLPTLMELRTLICENISRGKHIKAPLSSMTMGPIWTRSTEDDKYAFDFESLKVLIDNYYKDNTISAYDLCVRGDITGYIEPWMNLVIDWASKYDIAIPLDSTALTETKKLTIISKKYLKIHSMPDELRNLEHLEHLIIYADAKVIPLFMWQYPSLSQLSISVSGDLENVEITPSISHLELDGAISNLPSCISSLPNLQSIYLKSGSSLQNNDQAKKMLQEFVRSGGRLSLGSYMKHEDYGLRVNPVSNLTEVMD